MLVYVQVARACVCVCVGACECACVSVHTCMHVCMCVRGVCIGPSVYLVLADILRAGHGALHTLTQEEQCSPSAPEPRAQLRGEQREQRERLSENSVCLCDTCPLHCICCNPHPYPQ